MNQYLQSISPILAFTSGESVTGAETLLPVMLRARGKGVDLKALHANVHASQVLLVVLLDSISCLEDYRMDLYVVVLSGQQLQSALRGDIDSRCGRAPTLVPPPLTDNISSVTKSHENNIYIRSMANDRYSESHP